MCTTKVCGACRQEKPVEEFSLKNRVTGLRQSKCKPCVNAYGKTHYKTNQAVYVEKAARNRVTAVDRARTHLAKSLENKHCGRCESTEDLSFFQGVGAETQPVHMAVNAGLSIARVQAAIDRSELLCGKCRQAEFFAGIKPWSQLTHAQRVAAQAARTEEAAYKTTPGLYRRYRPVGAPAAAAE